MKTLLYDDGINKYWLSKTTNRVLIYYKNDLVHRDDGPAIIHPNGIEDWRKDGISHRLGGEPCYIDPNHKYQEWRVDGKYHRRYGPARIWYGVPSYDEWYYHGKRFHEVTSLKEFERQINLKAFW